MRSEQEVLALIVNTAKHDERIRAVIMNGSRVNPNISQDIFQDFDIVYIVSDVTPFKENIEWPNLFGDMIIMQLPESMIDPPPADDGSFTFLMLFTDGNRIDLNIYPIENYDKTKQDSLSKLLLDKDDVVKLLPSPSENDYLPKHPSNKVFSDCCNEFWWVCTNVAKGLWREEIVYAKHMLDQVLREQLIKLLTWHVGILTKFSKNPGNHGRFLKQYLEPDLWNMLQKTYSDADCDNTWEALIMMYSLFRRVAISVAEHFGFNYPQKEDKRVSAHLEHVRLLPKESKELY